MKILENREKCLRYAFAILLFAFCIVFLMNSWVPRYPDPFGYLANAAGLSGYNWQDTTMQIQRVYAAGYSLLLVPFFWICKSFVALSKCAYFLNICLFVIYYFILCRIADSILEDIFSKNVRSIICFIICLYPSNIYNIYTITPEILSLFLTSLLFFLMIKFNSTKNIKLMYIAAVIVGYFILVHSREIVIFCAFSLYVIYLAFIKDIDLKDFLKILLLLGISLLIYKTFNKYINNNILNIMKLPDGAYTPNSLESQLNKSHALFTMAGIKQLIKNICSQSFYIQTSTFGLFFVGIFYLIKKTFLNLLKKDGTAYYIFILLCILGMILLSAFFFINAERFDQIMYGRHIETIAPIIILVSFNGITNIIGDVISVLLTLFVGIVTIRRVSSLTFLGSIPRTICGWELFYDNMQTDNIWLLILCVLVILIGLSFIVIKKYNKILFVELIGLMCVFSLASFNVINREVSDNNLTRASYYQLVIIMQYNNKKVYSTVGKYNYIVQLMAYSEHVTVLKDDTLNNNQGDYIIYTEKNLDHMMSDSFKKLKLELSNKGRIYIFGEKYIKYVENIGYEFE